MRVGIIEGYNSYYNNFNYKSAKNLEKNKSEARVNLYDFSSSSIIYATPQINFESRHIPFKNYRGIICPCCGRKMIPQKTFDDNKKALENPLMNPQSSISLLAMFRENMNTVEQAVFKMLSAAVEKGNLKPGEDFASILNRAKQQRGSLKVLRQNEHAVLDMVSALVSRLPNGEAKSAVSSYIELSRELINSGVFTRRVFLDNIYKDLSGLIKKRDGNPSGDIAKEIYREAIKLPNSDNNIDAFLVKYSAKTYTEIAIRLIRNASATVEHIKPVAKGGENAASNLLLECFGCNNERQDMWFYRWSKFHHPEIAQNLPLYMNQVLNITKHDKKQSWANRIMIGDWTNYHRDVQRTLRKESTLGQETVVNV